MCGIAGFSGAFDRGLLLAMGEAIAHRGPDDHGVAFQQTSGIGLIHRRLSIIDVSTAGHQPMSDAEDRVVIVFNGEIYNFRELRKELELQGASFSSHSDTEVLLHLYLSEGEAMLSKLNGIFAFAIWDRRDNSLFIARDGFGVKPLYYAVTSSGVLFASEIKALVQCPEVSRGIDFQSLRHHLLFLWCPAPGTLLSGVRKLEPGYAMVLRESRIIRHWRHYTLPFGTTQTSWKEGDAIASVQTALRTAVGRQMVADVPLGAFLSGGLDSSAVVTFACEHAPERSLQCFTIAFDDDEVAREGMAEDLPYARRVAKHLGVNLHTVTVGPEMVDRLEAMIYQLDEPQADPAALNVWFISELARRHGIKVLLSGAGGDDIFSGYRRHYALSIERVWSRLPRPLRQAVAYSARALPTSQPILRRLQKLLQYTALEGGDRLASYFFWQQPSELARLLSPAVRNELGGSHPAGFMLDSLSELPRGAAPLDQMLYLESRYFLADHNLNYTDKMSMAAGVEVRVPLLDRDLVSLAASLPVNMKQRGRVGKWIFKKAMEPYLPHDVIYRPKTGFGAPVRQWLKNDLRTLVDDVLGERALRTRGLFEPAAVRRLIKLHREGQTDGAYTILSLLCIELWCRRFVDAPLRSSHVLREMA